MSIQKIAFKIETKWTERNQDEVEELKMFINDVERNLPSFSAARFFQLNRTTIFGIVNVVVTFTIVVIQFETTCFWNSESLNIRCTNKTT